MRNANFSASDMTEEDRRNLEFLLSLDEDELHRWFAEATEEELVYTINLLVWAQSAIAVMAMELEEMNESISTNEALEVLSKFMKK